MATMTWQKSESVFWHWYDRTSVTKRRMVLFYPLGVAVTCVELAVIQYLLNLALR